MTDHELGGATVLVGKQRQQQARCHPGIGRFRARILWGAEIDHADHVHVGFKRMS